MTEPLGLWMTVAEHQDDRHWDAGSLLPAGMGMVLERRISEFNIYDVAGRAGVSKSTVSRVINRSSRVKDETRERVEAAMRDLGYQPNSAARRLAGSADRRIGLVLPFFTEMFSSFYIHEILRGVGEVVSARDSELLLHIQSPESAGHSLDRRLRARAFLGGWVIADEKVPLSLLVQAGSQGVPFVVVNRTVDIPFVNCVSVDNRNGAKEATAHLIRLGHRRIATIAGALEVQSGADRLTGFLDAMREAGLRTPEEYIADCSFTPESAAAATARMLALPEPPTAVFAASDLMASGVYEAAFAAGVRVPADLSVIGFDDDYLARQMPPGLTTMRQPIRQMAAEAASWLLDRIDHRNGDALRTVLPATLVERESCAAPAAVLARRGGGV